MECPADALAPYLGVRLLLAAALPASKGPPELFEASQIPGHSTQLSSFAAAESHERVDDCFLEVPNSGPLAI